MAGILLFLIISPIFVGGFGYYAYLAWFRKDKFRNLSKKHSERYQEWPLGYYLTAWESTESYFWFARVALLLGLAMSLLFFGVSYGTVLAVIARLLSS